MNRPPRVGDRVAVIRGRWAGFVGAVTEVSLPVGEYDNGLIRIVKPDNAEDWIYVHWRRRQDLELQR